MNHKNVCPCGNVGLPGHPENVWCETGWTLQLCDGLRSPPHIDEVAPCSVSQATIELAEQSIREPSAELDAERKLRLELERNYAWALILSHQEHVARGEGGDALRLLGIDERVAALTRLYASCPVGTCDRCGKRAPLQPVGIPHGAEKHACAWDCEVTP